MKHSALLAGLGLGALLGAAAYGARHRHSRAAAAPDSASDLSMQKPPQDTAGALADSLQGAVSYGQGTAGCILQHHKAAADVLDWVDSDAGHAALADPDSITLTQALQDWWATLTPAQQERFYENWPEVDQRAHAITRQPDDHKEHLDVAGADRIDYSNFKGDYPTFSRYMAELYTAKYGHAPQHSAGAG